jgi:hypothetical protein
MASPAWLAKGFEGGAVAAGLAGWGDAPAGWS